MISTLCLLKLLLCAAISAVRGRIPSCPFNIDLYKSYYALALIYFSLQ